MQEKDPKYTWAIDTMYPSREAFRKDQARVRDYLKVFEELAKHPQGQVGKILETIKEAGQVLENLVVYANMKQDQDTRLAQSQKDMQEAMDLAQDFDAATSFFEPYLLSLPQGERSAMLEDPELEEYWLYLKKIFRMADHTLSAKEEALLAASGFLLHAPEDTYYFLTNSDLAFPPLQSLGGATLTGENFTSHEMNPDPAVRKEAFDSLYTTFKQFGNTLATTYRNNVKALVFLAKTRSFASAREMELYRDDVDPKVYDALLASIHRNMGLVHRYYAKKKELLGLKEQHMYDVYLPLVKGSSRTYSFEEARDLCIASVAVMGKEYQDIYKKAFDERWMDVYPAPGKAGGAYSSGSYLSQPFIKLNFNGHLDDVFTLAHEMGHSMHSYYAKKNNRFLDYQYTIFAAEVASTFNELLLLDYLKKQMPSPADQLELLDHHLNSFKSTVYRQTMFAEFEKIVHERTEAGENLTQEDLDQIYLDLNRQYFGSAMISDPLIAQEWKRIPHFYSNFYVYKYATGFSAATVLSQKVLQKEEGALERYFAFLKDGSKHFPIDQLKMAGADLSKPETVDQALQVFADCVDQLEKMESL